MVPWQRGTGQFSPLRHASVLVPDEFDDGLIDGHGIRPMTLRVLDDDPVRPVNHAASESDRAHIKVDVGPAQSAQLASPCTGRSSHAKKATQLRLVLIYE